MAIYHLHATVGKRQSGQSAGAKSAYLQRDGKYKKSAEELLHKESGNMPPWAAESPSVYWQSADLYERANAKLFTQIEFALPAELDRAQQIELARTFARQVTRQPADASGPLPYTLAIHDRNGSNPHCHLMISERANDGIERDKATWFKRANKKSPEKGGAAKTRTLQPRQWLADVRTAWAGCANQALDLAGHKVRIDHRTLAEQGLERLAGMHLGPHVMELEARGVRTDRGAAALDIAGFCERIERLNIIAERIENELNSHRAIEKSPVDRDRGRTDRAVGPGHGGADGRNPRDPGADQGRDRNPSPAVATPERSNENRARGRGQQAAQPDRSGAKINPVLDLEGLGSGGAGGVFSGSAERIRDLAACSRASRDQGLGERGADVAGFCSDLPGPAQGPARSCQTGHGLAGRTAAAVTRQLAAMGCRKFEVGIRDQVTGKMMNRQWSRAEIEKSVPWLKRMNARGNDIYVRPAQSEKHALILVDDVDGVTVAEMKARGHHPACVVETSPKNLQAWLKIDDVALSERLRATIAQEVAQMYGADPASADARHYGRLSGFTNRKDQHEDAYGRQPWVLCRQASGQKVRHGAALVDQARQRLEARELAAEQRARVDAIRFASKTGYDAVSVYRAKMKAQTDRWGGRIDWSRADWDVCKTLLKSGYNPERIKQAMAQASPAIESRKAGHIQDYCHRTVEKAMQEPAIQQAMAQRLSRRRGMSR
jgi:hypothetical protein